ncbi:hypothetical protein [Streptosporangium sp. NPDC051022]|uniref:hypothetical protein n=1 Tax=Streptosporangium sp. NPDC051022 TaxID=3155752 RepID=UPI00343ED293
MATVTRDAIARLVPAAPPGATAITIRELAMEAYPTLQLGSVLKLLYSLTSDGLAVRTGDDTGPHRYHLTESR